MKNICTYRVLGVMSGTSLDGLDLAVCKFTNRDASWDFIIEEAITLSYSKELIDKLKLATNLNRADINVLDDELGEFMGNACKQFTSKYSIDFISSHGHTVFHQPEKGLTLQIGNGEMISKIANCPVIYDFRSEDVSIGGQGAPLVPIVDEILFSDYDYCLNLGGIANVSYNARGKRVAYDIVPCNMILNTLANKLDLEFDKNGDLATQGEIKHSALDRWNALDYYAKSGPKSLGYEWVSANYFPDFENYEVKDLLATSVEHITQKIAECTDLGGNRKIMVTGGGAKNSYLINELRKKVKEIDVVVPNEQLIDFKEALAFAFLGVLRRRGEVNVLSSVTGAPRDSSSGKIVGFLA